MRFDHIGIVSKTLQQGRNHMEAVFQIQGWTQEFSDEVNLVQVQFGRDSSGICYELISPLDDVSPIAQALRSRRNILNHVAYLVADLEASHDRLREAGAVPTSDPKPAIAYGGNRIQFFLTPLRFIVELIEAPAHHHQYKDVG